MKVIHMSSFRQDLQEDQADALARSVVKDFQQTLQRTFLLPDGGPVSLLTAQRILCRYWEFPDEPDPKELGRRALRHEVAVLEEEERAVSHELFLTRRRLALLECPFAERDIIEHQSGLRGWVTAIDWSHEGFLVQVGKFGKYHRPVKGDNKLYLWGPSDVVGWRRVGEVPVAKALRAGWLDRSE